MKITRRAFPVGLAGIAGAALGCRDALPARAQTPVSAGNEGLHLTLAGPSFATPVLDPALVRDNATMTIVRQLFRGLLAFDGNLELQSALAASVTADAEGRVYDVLLRDGITFHDGRPIVAEDVASSFLRALDPVTADGDASALAAAGQLAGIDGAADVLAGRAQRLSGVEVRDATRLTIALTEPDAAFPEKLASVAASIVDTTVGQSIAANGTGPFRLDLSTFDEKLTMAHIDSPYNGHGTVSTLSFLTGAAAAMPGNLLQAGTIDIATGLSADEAALLADPASGVSIQTVAAPEFSLLFLALSPTMAPLDDPHIRRALQTGFPWTRLAEAAGASVRPARGIVAPGMLDRDWGASIPSYDLARARSEIAQSRYGEAARVPPIAIYTGQTSLSDPLRNVGVALQEYLGEPLGLQIEPVSVAWGDFLAGLPAGRFSTYSLTWVADYPDPSAFLRVLFGSDSPDNYLGYRSDAFDALISEALSITDKTSRADLYARAQQMLIDDAVVIPISFDIGYTAFRTGIQGVPVSPIGLVGLESIYGT
ncbi:MAG: ABC transporter substrate-binding protein [Thermomicrobiales bacterium]